MRQIANDRKLQLGLLAFALASAAAVIVLASQSSSATSAPIEAPASNFAVLEPATPAAMEKVSDEIKMRLDTMATHPGLPGGSKVAESPDGVEKVSEVGFVRTGGAEVTLAALGGDICAFIEGGVGGCDSADRVSSGQSFSAESAGCQSFRVLAVVPDGVAHVALDIGADGKVDTTLPVVSNVYVGVLDAKRTVATGIGESGGPRFSVTIPLDSYAEGGGC